MGALDRFGIAEGSGQLMVGAVVVEGFLFGPQALDQGAGFREAAHRLRGVVEGQTVGFVLSPGQWVVGAGADADAEVEPASGDHVDGCGDLGQHRGWPEAVAGHHDAES